MGTWAMLRSLLPRPRPPRVTHSAAPRDSLSGRRRHVSQQQRRSHTWRQVRDCYAVHGTFTEFGDAGKRWRMLESGLWAPLPQSYFTDGNFLTFDPPKPPADPAPCEPGEGRHVASGAPPQTCGGEDTSILRCVEVVHEVAGT